MPLLFYLSMDIKEKITGTFDKSKFELLNGGRDIPVLDGEWEGVDEYIRDFIKDLNKCENIYTLFSCEGHKENDHAYLFFNIDEIGWDIFWQKVLPELSHAFCFINPELHPDALYQIQWQLSTCYNDKNEDVTPGINIIAELSSFMTIGWENKKERFWNTVKEIFLKYFQPKEEVVCPVCKSNDIETNETLRRTGGPRVTGKLMSYGYYLEIHFCKQCTNIWDGKKLNL